MSHCGQMSAQAWATHPHSARIVNPSRASGVTPSTLPDNIGGCFQKAELVNKQRCPNIAVANKKKKTQSIKMKRGHYTASNSTQAYYTVAMAIWHMASGNASICPHKEMHAPHITPRRQHKIKNGASYSNELRSLHGQQLQS